MLFISTVYVLVDRTATQYESAFGIILSSVCPSVCLSVTLYIVALRVGVGG